MLIDKLHLNILINNIDAVVRQYADSAYSAAYPENLQMLKEIVDFLKELAAAESPKKEFLRFDKCTDGERIYYEAEYKVIHKSHGDILGFITWLPKWRCYEFLPNDQTGYSSGCMAQIAAELERLDAERRAK